MILQLDPTLPVYIPDSGMTGQALLVIDPGTEHHLLWTVAMDHDGSLWTLSNPEVRVQFNFTMGRRGNKMPLVKGNKAKTKKGFSTNVKREMDAGKSQKQSVAIAYSEAGEKRKKKIKGKKK